MKAVDLRAGDRLQLVNGEYVTVEQVQHEILESPITVYNFRVADNHTYYVGDSSNAVLVHNMNCNFELPKTVKSKKGVSGNFSESGFTYRIDTNKIAPGEGGFHLHVMQKGKEVAKLNGFGGYVKNHKGRTLLKPSQMNKNVRKEINKLIKHVQKNL